MSAQSFGTWFQAHAGCRAHEWQVRLGEAGDCGNRLIRIPTGMGKTLGALSAWTYNRVIVGADSWPRRLVWCLPMRTLVEQTADTASEFIRRAGQADEIGVHILMGGADTHDWHLYPEKCAVLIGTQDMLLSRALNRGYAAPRARWPMEFGLLNHDCLWVMDEVQLMDVGLATSAQLQTFREEDANRARMVRPCFTWWMSATLQPNWLKSVDSRAMVEKIGDPQEVGMPALETGAAANRKTLALRSVKDNKALARLVDELHEPNELTLVVVNRVKDAVAVVEGLKTSGAEVRLVHSRFRPTERAKWRTEFLYKQAALPAGGRIIVATQVVEAGVDISAGLLITDLAPWPSLVQRFGRCARFPDESGRIVVADRGITANDDDAAMPYAAAELVAARACVKQLDDASLARLEAFERQLAPVARTELFPYDPMHLLLRREVDELFDTTPDLTGADLDISRFIRSGEERDALVFWRDVPKGMAPGAMEASRDELCPVATYEVKGWLFEKGSAAHARKWVWDYLAGVWRSCRKEDVYPGQTILVERTAGGYSMASGWTGLTQDVPDALPSPTTPGSDREADKAQEREDLSHAAWKTILTHGRETAEELRRIANELGMASTLADPLALSALWHDVGKAHPAFQNCIQVAFAGHPRRSDLAKAPPGAWKSVTQLYAMPSGGERRRGFRHELATALAMIAVLVRANPAHAALLGPFLGLLRQRGIGVPAPQALEANPAEQELLALDADTFNLVIYLACAHHGKLRGALHATPQDQEYRDRDGRGMPIRGVRAGDRLPSIDFSDSRSGHCLLPETELNLEPAAMGLSSITGPSWSDRVQTLLERHGPFALGWMEALLRAADIRASRLGTADPLLAATENGGAA